MAIPEVLVRVRYYAPGSKGRDFYSSEKKDDYLGYIDKGVKSSAPSDYIDYAGDAEKSSGVFDSSGLLDTEGKKAVREQLRTTKSVIWDVVISFEEKYGKENVASWGQARNLLSKTLSGFFRKAGLSPSNVGYIAGLHENTDNRHIHLEFWEKGPEHYDARKKERVFRRGKLPLGAIDSFKASIFRHFMTPVESSKRVRQMMLEATESAVSGDFMDDLEGFSKCVRRIYDEIPLTGELGYSSRNMDGCRADVDRATHMIVDEMEMAPNWALFKARMKKRDDEMRSFCESEKIDPTPYMFQLQFMRDLERRMGNVLIKEVVRKRREEKEAVERLHHPKAIMKCHKRSVTSLLERAAVMDQMVRDEAWDIFDEFEMKMREAERERHAEEGKDGAGDDGPEM